MRRRLQVDYKELVTCFFEECEREFRFLEEDHNFSYMSGLVFYQDGRQVIKPYQNQDIPDPFYLTTRYEKGDIALEVNYGDSDFSVEPYLHFERIQRLSWYEILWVGRQYDGKSAQKDVLSREKISETVSNISKLMKNNEPLLVNPSRNIIKKAGIFREKQLEEAVRSHSRSSLEHATKIASKAYRKRDYRMVIEILAPYEFMLGRSDLKKIKTCT